MKKLDLKKLLTAGLAAMMTVTAMGVTALAANEEDEPVLDAVEEPVAQTVKLPILDIPVDLPDEQKDAIARELLADELLSANEVLNVYPYGIRTATGFDLYLHWDSSEKAYSMWAFDLCTVTDRSGYTRFANIGGSTLTHSSAAMSGSIRVTNIVTTESPSSVYVTFTNLQGYVPADGTWYSTPINAQSINIG